MGNSTSDLTSQITSQITSTFFQQNILSVKIGSVLRDLEELGRIDLAINLVLPLIEKAELFEIVYFIEKLHSDSPVAKRIILEYNPKFQEEPDIQKHFQVYANFPRLLQKVSINPRVLENIFFKIIENKNLNLTTQILNSALRQSERNEFKIIEFLQTINSEIIEEMEKRGNVSRFDIVNHPSDFEKLICIGKIPEIVGNTILLKNYSPKIFRMLIEKNIAKVNLKVLERHSNNLEISLVLLDYFYEEIPETLYSNLELLALAKRINEKRTSSFECSICFENNNSKAYFKCPKNNENVNLVCFSCASKNILKCHICRNEHNLVLVK